MLDWFEKLDTKLVGDLLERWASPEELQEVPPAEPWKFFVSAGAGIKNSPSSAWRATARPCRPFGIERCWRGNEPWWKRAHNGYALAAGIANLDSKIE
jgi:hypothetical protein